MEQSAKRPVLVWVIFIWFIFAGCSALYQYYGIYSGHAELPEGIERPSGLAYFFQAVGFQLLFMLSAGLLFFKVAAAKWLFSALVVLSVVSMSHTLLTTHIPEGMQNFTYSVMAISLAIYVGITYYCFRLSSKGYFNVSYNQ